MGQGFDVTKSNGVGDSVGLYGTISGTFSYASITLDGSAETAAVTSSAGALLTITDSNNVAFTAAISGVDIATLGTAGAINVDGSINLTNAQYSGMNIDLLDLKNDVQASGGIMALTFQFVPAESLSQLAASGSDLSTSYSGTIAATAVSEPGSLLLGSVALGIIVLITSWRRCF